MKTNLTMEESLKREKGMALPKDFSESACLAVSHNLNCIKALQKQVPMEVTDIELHYFTCPSCGREDSTFDIGQAPGYCRNCGQALKD